MHSSNTQNPLVPGIVEVVKIIDETPDVKNFYVRCVDGGVPFNVMPGQLAMVSLVPVGKLCFQFPGRKRMIIWNLLSNGSG